MQDATVFASNTEQLRSQHSTGYKWESVTSHRVIKSVQLSYLTFLLFFTVVFTGIQYLKKEMDFFLLSAPKQEP